MWGCVINKKITVIWFWPNIVILVSIDETVKNSFVIGIRHNGNPLFIVIKETEEKLQIGAKITRWKIYIHRSRQWYESNLHNSIEVTKLSMALKSISVGLVVVLLIYHFLIQRCQKKRHKVFYTEFHDASNKS